MTNCPNSNYEILVQVLEKHGKTLKDLYDNGIISRQLVSELKSGRTNRLSSKKVMDIADFLSCPIAEVIGYKEEEQVINALQNARDVDRVLFEVTSKMTTKEVEILTEFARTLKNANRGY